MCAVHACNTHSTSLETSTGSGFPGDVDIFLWHLETLPWHPTRLSSLIQKVDDFVTEVIAVHRKTLDPSAPEDVIDSVLLLMDKARTLLDWVWVGRKESDGHTADTELVCYSMMFVFFLIEILP